MARPTNEQMLRTILEIIDREGGISRKSLESQLTWASTTIDLVIERAIQDGLVSVGVGGGGGVLRVIHESQRQEEKNHHFMAALARLSKDGQGVKSEDLCVELGWDDSTFKATRKALHVQQKIHMNPGRGALLFAIAEGSDLPATMDDAPPLKPEAKPRKLRSKSPSGTPEPEPEAQPSQAPDSLVKTQDSLVKAPEAEIFADELREELIRRRDRSESLDQEILRKYLHWDQFRFWQARTNLVDRGLITCRYNSPKIELHAQPQQRSPAEIDLPKQLEILETLARRGGPMAITELATALGLTVEPAVIACSRLVWTHLINPLAKGMVVLNDLITTPTNASSNQLELLRLFDKRPQLAISRIRDQLRWPPNKVDEALKSCENDKLLTLDLEGQIATATNKTSGYLRQNEERQVGNPCISSLEFAELHRAIRTQKVVAFVGAGASAEAKIPGWESLMRRAMEQPLVRSQTPAEAKEIDDLLSRRDYTNAASAIEARLGETRFNEHIQRHLSSYTYPASPASLALALLRTSYTGMLQPTWTSSCNLRWAVRLPRSTHPPFNSA